MTMQVIQHIELGSAQANIEFTSIPQTFTDLLIVYSARSASAGGGVRMRFNGSTSGYSERLLYGEGSGAGKSASTTTQSGFVWLLSNRSDYTSNTFASGQIYIPNYRVAANKSISAETVTENNATAAEIYIDAGLWANTAAITSILFTNPDGNTAAGSSFTLFGITSGSDGTTTVS